MTIRAYTSGEISLGKAAGMLGVSHQEMKDIIREEGAEIHLGPETVEELLQDAAGSVNAWTREKRPVAGAQQRSRPQKGVAPYLTSKAPPIASSAPAPSTRRLSHPPSGSPR